MSYEHCDKHDEDATNGCRACWHDDLAAELRRRFPGALSVSVANREAKLVFGSESDRLHQWAYAQRTPMMLDADPETVAEVIARGCLRVCAEVDTVNREVRAAMIDAYDPRLNCADVFIEVNGSKGKLNQVSVVDEAGLRRISGRIDVACPASEEIMRLKYGAIATVILSFRDRQLMQCCKLALWDISTGPLLFEFEGSPLVEWENIVPTEPAPPPQSAHEIPDALKKHRRLLAGLDLVATAVPPTERCHVPGVEVGTANRTTSDDYHGPCPEGGAVTVWVVPKDGPEAQYVKHVEQQAEVSRFAAFREAVQKRIGNRLPPGVELVFDIIYVKSSRYEKPVWLCEARTADGALASHGFCSRDGFGPDALRFEQRCDELARLVADRWIQRARKAAGRKR